MTNSTLDTTDLIAEHLYRAMADDEAAYAVAEAITRDPQLTINRREVITGEWEDVQAALDQLPEGTQIRWRTGMANRPELAVHRGPNWHATNSPRPIDSESIARDNTPIEVLA